MKLRAFLLASIFCLSISCRPAAAEAPTRAAIQRLIEQQAHAWETGDEQAFLSSLDEHAVFAYPGKRLSREGALSSFRGWKRDFRDTQLHVTHLVIDGSQFAVEYMFATTNVATGKRTAGGTVAVGEVRDGRILSWKEYLDGRVSRLQATGELPVDEAAEPFPWPDTPESRKP
jgi:uncharacterized protein (TIGR02246 family)